MSPQTMADRGQLLESPLERVVIGEIGAGLQDGVPIGFRAAHNVLDMAGHIVAHRSGHQLNAALVRALVEAERGDDAGRPAA